MKILSVKTRKLHKYINAEITFKDELSIITGINGSGKTSILKLIDAVLKVDINKINNIAFEFFSLDIIFESKDYNIKLTKDTAEPGSTISFSVNNSTIHSESTSKLKTIFGHRKSLIVNDFINKFESEVSTPTSDFNLFSKINPPMLIGLNRRISNKKIEQSLSSDIFDSHEISFFEEHEPKELDSFDIALSDCKTLILNEFKRVKKYENAQMNVLKNSIITSSFTYIDNYDEIFSSSDMIGSKFSEIKQRKNEILETLNNLEIKDSELSSLSSSFFSKLEGLYDKAITKNNQETDNKYTLEYLLNITQVERISNLVKIIDKHKSTLDEKKVKIDLFEKIVNSFFMQTDKKLVINSIGNVYASIKNSDHKVEIDELSSGEKQLVIIIANMVFSRKNNISVIIIDEPEISLHIKWQDMFISALKKINSEIQIILATHSPDIIGEYDDCCTPIEQWS